MTQREFRAQKFLGCGWYTFVYSVISLRKHDRGQSYALKRFFLRQPTPVLSAKRECDILKRITLDPHSSPFLQKLYYSLVIEFSPVLVLTEALGITIYDIINIKRSLNFEDTKFYLSEIICGLKFLHNKCIVHMELKPDNILIAKSGHILISDFDRSYDLSRGRRPIRGWDFCVNQYFAAPEIANEQVISEKADVWSLGVLTAWLIGKYIRPKNTDKEHEKQMAKQGYWIISGFSKLPKYWQEFFNQVFSTSYVLRPSIEQVQRLTLFRNVNWHKVERLKVKPPLSTDCLMDFINGMKRDHNPTDPVLLQSLYTFQMPKVQHYNFQYVDDLPGYKHFIYVLPNIIPPPNFALTLQEIFAELRKFNFIHPVLNYRRLLLK
nr:ribosomal protein S6 kinase alpha 2 [Hymenolepis microstoma]